MRLGEADVPQLARLEADPAVRLLFVSPQIAVGEFRCSPGDPRWSQENCAEEGHFAAFPGPSVVIQHGGREPAVVSRNEVVLYNQGQTYRRALLDPAGDHCVFLMIAPGLLSELAVAAGVGRHADRPAFSSPLGPVDAGTFLLQRTVAGALRAHPPDRLRVEEALYRLVFAAANVGFRRADRQRRPARPRTRAAHALLVEETFDFWLGEWTLTWNGGEGRNLITSELDGRVILERFDGRPSVELRGMSLSVHDADAGLWRQTWVDSDGRYLDFAGGMRDGEMDLRRDGVRDGRPAVYRMRWYDIARDSLRWDWECSTDGETWQTLWAIVYLRSR